MRGEGAAISTFFTDPPVLLAAGLLYALFDESGRRRPPRPPFYRHSAFRHGLLWALLAFAETWAASRLAPGESWLARFPSRGPFALPLALIFGDLLPFTAGYALGVSSKDRGRRFPLLGAALCAPLEMGWARSLLGLQVVSPGTPLTSHPALLALLGASALAGSFTAAGIAAARRRRGLPAARALNGSEAALVDAISQRLFVPPPRPDRSLGMELAEYLADLDGVRRALIKLALFALRWSPLFFLLRPQRLDRLPPALMDRCLLRWEHSANPLLHAVYLPIKMLLCLKHYEDAPMGTFQGSRPSTVSSCSPELA